MPGPPACWPRCDLFDPFAETLDMPLEEWMAGMRRNIMELNWRVLVVMDQMIEQDRDAVYVIKSDHGARYSLGEQEEWKRSFLAASTPGHPNLFVVEPAPVVVLDRVLRTYEIVGLPPAGHP